MSMGMSITRIRVFGFEPAFTDLRNPKESWALSDSKFYADSPYYPCVGNTPMQDMKAPWQGPGILVPEWPFIGPADMKLACGLTPGGGAHRKFLREIIVWWTIAIPRALWQELDTYKVSTVRNSCSTMHKLGSRELTVEDFADQDVRRQVLADLNVMGQCYRLWLSKAGKDDPAATYLDPENGKEYRGVKLLRHMKFTLPESYLQRAGYMFSYETALKIYYDRHDHRMEEWSRVDEEDGICLTIRKLPYMDQLIEAMGKMRG
jgi:hypothetical protein